MTDLSDITKAKDLIDQLGSKMVVLMRKEDDALHEVFRLKGTVKHLQDKLDKAVEALEKVSTILFSAVQGDNEHGVRALNEAAAKNYLKDFPLTLAALSEVQNAIDATLAELEGK